MGKRRLVHTFAYQAKNPIALALNFRFSVGGNMSAQEISIMSRIPYATLRDFIVKTKI